MISPSHDKSIPLDKEGVGGGRATFELTERNDEEVGVGGMEPINSISHIPFIKSF